MQKYFIGLKINNYYSVHIIEDGYEQTEMVEENNIDGFIQCLEYLGYTQQINSFKGGF